jgi:microcystin-dependent protein
MKDQIKNYRNTIALFLMLLSQSSFSQVGIGTSSPNSESVLDLSGVNNKGLVLPTTTSTNPFNATGTKEGMLMFNTNNKLIYYSTDNGTALNALSPWTYVPGTGLSNHVLMKLSKNVGIGTNTPKVKFHLIGDNQADYLNNSKGYLMLGDHTAQHLVFDNQQIISKSDGITPSTLKIQPGGDVIISNDLGNVGIGKTPSQKLDVDGNINSSSGKIKEGGNDLIPAGVIVMWSGTTPPDGWELCDGTGTGPNLQGRFIVGFGTRKKITRKQDGTFENGANQTYNVGDNGGADDVKIKIAELPEHDHGGSVTGDGVHEHTLKDYYRKSTPDGGGWGLSTRAYVDFDYSNRTTKNTGTSVADIKSRGGHSHGIDEQGSNEAHENRPPYYVLAYIIKI